MIFERIVKIERLTSTVGDVDKESYTTIITSVPMGIHPSSEETTIMYEGSFGETFEGYSTIAASGVLKGDRVTTISGRGVGEVYTARGISNQNKPPMPHMKFVLFKAKPNQNE